MKRKFDTLRETLDEFARQDEFSLLVIGCPSECVAYVAHFFTALDSTLPSHLVLGFTQPFDDPQRWLDAIVASLRQQLHAAQVEREARGESPHPPMPMELEDGRAPPVQRLRALLHYLVSLLPDESDYRLLVAFLPSACRDVQTYVALMQALIPEGPTVLGHRAARVVAWDIYEGAGLRAQLLEQHSAHALTYADDLRTPALTAALTTDASNTELPLAERMASFQQLAALDYSYKRYADALDKYAVLHAFHHERGQHGLAAVALLGAGDTLSAAGDPVNAKLRLQQGIATAMACKSLPALSNLLSSITEVCMTLGHHAEAESYADSGTKVASASLNPFVYADMFSKRGDAQLAQDRSGDAMRSYERCRELCKSYGHFPRWYAVLDKQAALYEGANMDRERRAIEHEYAEAQALERGQARSGAAT